MTNVKTMSINAYNYSTDFLKSFFQKFNFLDAFETKNVKLDHIF